MLTSSRMYEARNQARIEAFRTEWVSSNLPWRGMTHPRATSSKAFRSLPKWELIYKFIMTEWLPVGKMGWRSGFHDSPGSSRIRPFCSAFNPSAQSNCVRCILLKPWGNALNRPAVWRQQIVTRPLKPAAGRLCLARLVTGLRRLSHPGRQPRTGKMRLSHQN